MTTFLVCAPLAGASAMLHHVLALAAAVPMFVCVLLLTAWKLRFRTALIACVVAALCLDFFFTEPRYSLRVFSGQDISAICSFLAVVPFISWLSNRLSAKTEQLNKREQAQQALHLLAERSLQLDWRLPLPEELCRAVRSCFQLEAVCIWDAIEQRFIYDGQAALDMDTLRAAFMAERDFDLPRSHTCIRMLRSGIRLVGTISLQGDLPDQSILGAMSSLVSLTMERARALNSEVSAQSERLSEQLRSSVLDGLAHAIKTPLTTIAVSSAGVQAIGGLTDTQRKLLDLVQQQEEHITSLTNRLLRTARLDAKAVVRRREATLSQIFASATEGMEGQERLVFTQTNPSSVLWTDSELLAMAIHQIVENAIKYSPSESPVHIFVDWQDTTLTIAVHNQNSYIPPAESSRVFQRFYRAQGSEHRAPGTGLGLSIAQQAIDALGGQIALDSSVEAGTTFTSQIPIEVYRDARLTAHR